MEPAPPETVSAECPACGATLRNVSADPGVKLHCLNCGKRFVRTPPQASENTPLAADGPARIAPAREPGSPGYWLLRIPALIALAAGTLFGGIAAFQALASLSSNYRWRAETFWGMSYIPLLFWLPLALVLLLQALAALDRALVRRAWREQAFAAIPAPPGSSLPYVAPLAVAGGALPIMVLCAFGRNNSGIIPAGLVGAVLFYFSFALEDIRQFVWRLEHLGLSRIRKLSPDYRVAEPAGGYSGLLLAGAAGCAGFAFLMAALELSDYSYQRNYYSSYRRSELFMQAFGCLSCFGLALPLYLLGRGWDRAAGRWREAERMSTQRRPFFPEFTASQNWLRMIPIIWAGAGLVWVFYMTCKHSSHERLTVLAAIGSSAAGGACLVVWLSHFLSQLFRLQRSLHRSWNIHKLPAWPWLAKAGWALAAVQTSFYVLFMIDSFFRYPHTLEFEIVAGIPLMAVMLHYPALWFAVVAGTFLRLRTGLERAPQAATTEACNERTDG